MQNDVPTPYLICGDIWDSHTQQSALTLLSDQRGKLIVQSNFCFLESPGQLFFENWHILEGNLQ